MTEVINDTDEKQKFIRGYSAMVLYRALEKKAMAAQRQGRIGFYMQSSGQEAAQIGLSMALDEDTLFYEYYRDLPMMIHRGVPLE
ncbi:MAG: thiamine pyrophosphate-dependent enzyme, partial [Candidatus Thermoplasmatota archaeon]|nr:thiamine pyrophosphate-dependent enzyme [Candidatus Thermoplasmatota archaeon]